ncbi:MAG TPA: phosphatase PAP2 family protein [Stellaceae bacterium]
MIHSFLHALTNLGDSIITLPIAAVVLVWLAIWGDRRVALTWLTALIACGAVTAVLKIYFKACPVPGLELDSPSGHTSMSLFVYGGLTLITAGQFQHGRRHAVLALGGLLILAIALSRAVLEYHSVLEVVIGLIIGSATLTLFWMPYRRHRPARMPVWPLWVAALVPIAFLSGRSISAEGLLHRIAIYIHAIVGFCV